MSFLQDYDGFNEANECSELEEFLLLAAKKEVSTAELNMSEVKYTVKNCEKNVITTSRCLISTLFA